MRFLVTGGAGFIGSHLCDSLLSAGHDVHVLDDLSTGSIDNIRHLEQEPRFSCTVESATNGAVVADLVDEADVVFHLAAAVGVDLIVESPVRTIETNVHCAEVVLAHASRRKKPVFLTSTSEVYGKSDALPFSEDGDLRLGPTTTGRWAYACSKALDEFLAIAYWKERKLPTVVVRLFNTVGPRQTGRYGMVLPRFVRQAVAGHPLTVFGSGEQSRASATSGTSSARCAGWSRPSRTGRSSTSAPARRSRSWSWPSACARWPGRAPRSRSSRTRRPSRRATRTCSGACPTRRGSAS